MTGNRRNLLFVYVFGNNMHKTVERNLTQSRAISSNQNVKHGTCNILYVSNTLPKQYSTSR